MIKLIVDGYKRLYKNGGFTHSQIVEDFNKSYHEENNPALSYLQDYDGEHFNNTPVNDIYEEYEAWCKDNAVNYNRNMIRNTIIEKFEMKVKVVLINGKSTRCFVYNVGD